MNHLEFISHQLMIIIGIFMYIFGTIGNLLNIYVFYIWSHSKKHTRKSSNSYRTSNSSLYLLTASIGNLVLILYPLSTRIIFDGFQYSVTNNTVAILCRIRYYILHTSDLMSITCICMATFDRYLISSRKARLRRLSTTKKRTKQTIFIITCLYSLHSIPLAYFFDVSGTGQCSISSRTYLYYYLWTFQIILRGLLPISFLTIVCLLTFKQLNKNKRVKYNGHLSREKQFSRMLLLISFAIVLSSIPYCIEHIYYVMISDNRSDQSSLTYFYHVISSILFYTNAVTSFYIFYISTPNFRAQVQRLIYSQRNLHHRTSKQIKIIVIERNSRI
ncbi:unnamed protein product [Adineta steineri]|uniref:G-protein coupled receptors family 1 profile domain-containing protein n=1 Tax=Adineta steineri TaxID=433720 RepID=A0A815Q3E2_9BILA|nr:unnamed protein product [Adineta steineri]